MSGTRFFIYSRKSVYTDKGESIENQIEMCRQYIQSKFPEAGLSDITVYEDEGFSAKNTERPQFQQMLRDIQHKKPDFVVCYRLDRISRSVSDFSSLIEELNDRRISFVCVKEEFDTSKPMGKAMMYIASVFAQLERETIAERVRDNMLLLARTGRWLGGTTPTGYTSEKQQEILLDGRRKTSCKLKGNPEELQTVNTMFEKFLELRSVTGVSKFLIKQGITARGGGGDSLPGIKEILQNPVYCIADKDAWAYFTAQNADVCFEEKDCSGQYGLLAYNKRDYTKKHAPRQPVDKWIIAIGRHKGCIPGRKWAAVQRLLADNIPTGKKPAKMHNGYSLLSGLIFCEGCGSRLFAKPRSGQGGLFDYVCGSKLKGGTGLCGCQNIGGRQADDLVYRSLFPYMEESPRIDALLREQKRALRGQAREDEQNSAEARIRRCSGEMDRLVEALSRGALDPALIPRINARVRELKEEIARLSKERRPLPAAGAASGREEAAAAKLAGSLADIKSCAAALSVPEKRALIRLLVQKIVWDGKDLHLYMNGR